MAKDPNQYRRKLSAEEVQEQYIMVLKDYLKFFPKIGRPFKLKVSDKEYESRVDAVECWCMGPQKPHSHYRISTRNFRQDFPLHRGATVTITKVSDEQYTLS